MGDAADRAGVGVETLSRLKYAADQSDVEFSSLTIAIKRWQVTLSQASTGSKDAASALGLLKLNAAELKDLSLEEQLGAIANQFARIRNPADQTRVAVELFGRAGEQLVPLLKKGGGAIDELIAKADELGITLDSRTAQAADRTDKALKKLFATIDAGAARVGGTFAEIFFPDESELAAVERKIEEFKRNRDALADPNWLEKLTMSEDTRQKLLANFNAAIDQQLRAVNAIQRRMRVDGRPLEIPKEPEKISDVLITQRKAELQGLSKLLDDFEQSTRTSEEKIYQDYRDTVNKIQEISATLGADETAKRLRDARTKYEDAVTIDPVKISQTRVIVTQVLSDNQRAVNKFVDTLSVGLDNLAHSGELTGKSILKYLLSAFEAQVLKDAIDGLGRYLKKSLGEALDGSGGSAGSFAGALFNGLFGGSTKLSGKSGVGALNGSTVGYAAGGGKGGMRWVGEDGPELDTGGGNIMNRRQLQFAMAGGGGGGLTIHQGDVNVSTSATDPAAVAQYVNAVVQQSNRKLLEQMNAKLKDTYGRAPR